MLSNIELIKAAQVVLSPRRKGDFFMGQVGTALVTEEGNIFKGVSIDLGSGLGFCAERTAISQMVTNKEYKIKKIVAVWNDNPDKKLYILPPCGTCRHYMHMVSEDALDIDVVIGPDETVKLSELYPKSEFPEYKPFDLETDS